MIDVNNPPVAILYGFAGTTTKGEAIVDHIDGEMVRLIAWRGSPRSTWVTVESLMGAVRLDVCEPHPHADELLAEFTAWQLTR